jgi:hypothetical protein
MWSISATGAEQPPADQAVIELEKGTRDFLAPGQRLGARVKRSFQDVNDERSVSDRH